MNLDSTSSMPSMPLMGVPAGTDGTPERRAGVPCTPDAWRLDDRQTLLMDRLALDGRWTPSPEERAGWETVEDIVKNAEDCLSASTSGRHVALLLNAAQAAAVRAALASLPECLYRPLPGIPRLRELGDKLDDPAGCALTRGDLEVLATTWHLTKDLRIGTYTQKPGDDRALLAQRARFAQWIHAAPTQDRARCRAATVDAILDAADRMEKHGGAGFPTVLPFSVLECAELPPPGIIGTVCYRAGAALMLRSMHLYRMPDPAQFKESAERLGIEHLDCRAPDGTLVEGCNLSTLSMLSLWSADPSRLDAARLFGQMRAMPRLRCVMLPRGLELPGIPKGWDYGPALNVLQRYR